MAMYSITVPETSYEFIRDILHRERNQSPPNEEELTITAKVKEFSNTRIHAPGSETLEEFIDYDIDSESLKCTYLIKVHPNGHNSSTEGFVSVEFINLIRIHIQESPSSVRLTRLSGSISVVNVEDNKRLSHTFAMCNDFSSSDPGPDRMFVVGDISRSHLLEDPTEWLPEDTLTLQMDVVLEKQFGSLFATWDASLFEAISTDFQREDDGPDGPTRHYLLLDSYFAYRLGKESKYFERLRINPMQEREEGRVKVPEEEFSVFATIGNIFFSNGPIAFVTVDDIFDVYVIADKYGITLSTDTCRRWLELCLTDENAWEIRGFADEYNDGRLREAVDVFLGKEDHKEGEEEKDRKSKVDVKPGDAAGSAVKEWTLLRRNSESGHRLEYWLTEVVEGENTQKQPFNFYV